MTLLQFIIIIASIIFFLFWIDLFKHKKATLLHLIIFIWWSVVLIIFAINNKALDSFWSFFGIARWADLIVYSAIIILAYFYISLLNTVNRQDIKQTEIIRQVSISNATWTLWDADTVFIIPAYNEKDTPIEIIWKILSKWYGVILIDDGLNDDLIEKLQKKYKWKPIVTIKHIVNLWQWWALETWAEYVRKYGENIKYVVHFDADWQHRLEDLK